MEAKDKPTAKNEDDPEKKKRRRKKRVPSRVPMPLEAHLESGGILPTDTKNTETEKDKKKTKVSKKRATKEAEAEASPETQSRKKTAKEKKPESKEEQSAAQANEAEGGTAIEAQEAAAGEGEEVETSKDNKTKNQKPARKQSSKESVSSNDNEVKPEPEYETEVAPEAAVIPEAPRTPRVLTEPEGELFVSERWRRQRESSAENVPAAAAVVPVELHDPLLQPPQEAVGEASSLSGAPEIAPAGVPIPSDPETRQQSQSETRTKDQKKDTSRPTHIRRSSGALAGAVAGATVEHLRHKKREKAADKVIKDQKKQVEQLEGRVQMTEQKLQRTTESHRKTERVKTELEKRLEKLRNVQTAPGKAPKISNEREPQSDNTKQVKQSAESKRAERPAYAPLHNPEFQSGRHDQRAAVAKQAEVAQAKNLKNPSENLEVPKDHRIEHSAWHSIEVDRNTGKIAENQTITYGEEFRNEQHQEQLRRQIDEASEDSKTVRRRYDAHGELQTQRTTISSTSPVAIPTLPVPSAADQSETRRQKTPAKPASVPRVVQRPGVQAHITITDVVLWAGLGIVVLAILMTLGVF